MTFYCSVGYRKPFYFERRYLVTYSYLFTYLYQEQGQFFFSSTSALSFICTYFTTQNQNKIQFYLCWRVAKFKQLISAFVKVPCLIFGTALLWLFKSHNLLILVSDRRQHCTAMYTQHHVNTLQCNILIVKEEKK